MFLHLGLSSSHTLGRRGAINEKLTSSDSDRYIKLLLSNFALSIIHIRQATFVTACRKGLTKLMIRQACCRQSKAWHCPTLTDCKLC